MKIAIVTDSTSDLPREILSRWEIFVIPTILVMDNESIQDDGQFSREEYYDRLPTMENLPTTAAPSVGSFEKLYQSLFDQGYEKIVSVQLASSFSAIYNAAQTAAQAFGDRVTVVDSQQISMALGFQALYAAQAASRGESIQSILQVIESIRSRTRLIAMLDTLDYVRRSGRLSWARATIGNFLRIKPFIEVKDGRALRLGEARTRRKGIERLHELLNEQGPLDKLAVMHSNAEQDARQFLADLHLPSAVETFVINVTPVIGTHVGPNGLGFTAVSIA